MGPSEGGAGGTHGEDRAGAGNNALGGAESGGAEATGGAPDVAGAAGDGGAMEPTCRPALPVTFRDFKPNGVADGHEDFEMSARGVKNNDGSDFKGWNDIGCGLVQPTLGADRKPRVFAGPADTGGGVVLPGIVGRQRRVVTGPGCFAAGTTAECSIGACVTWDITPPTYSIRSAATFDQWFNTVDGVNLELSSELVLTEKTPSSGMWSFDSDAFFPLDGAGFGNSPGLAHNYSFSTEAHVRFKYVPGQLLKFRGDDDLWLFVNGKLALDVGGQHQPLTAAVDLDAQAAALGIVPGQTYSLDLFHAERQSTDSTFQLTTNIACFEPG
ncbi:MAG: hypothetical protein K0R38_4385 [Polyangiaceae bacterium]|jgi:fibro-slime domain-containing protein|nr:hypothetical protein [Polyangiaceae bacterium]